MSSYVIWLLISVSTGRVHQVQVVEQFNTKSDCQEVLTQIPQPNLGTLRLKCVPAKVAR